MANGNIDFDTQAGRDEMTLGQFKNYIGYEDPISNIGSIVSDTDALIANTLPADIGTFDAPFPSTGVSSSDYYDGFDPMINQSGGVGFDGQAYGPFEAPGIGSKALGAIGSGFDQVVDWGEQAFEGISQLFGGKDIGAKISQLQQLQNTKGLSDVQKTVMTQEIMKDSAWSNPQVMLSLLALGINFYNNKQAKKSQDKQMRKWEEMNDPVRQAENEVSYLSTRDRLLKETGLIGGGTAAPATGPQITDAVNIFAD